MSTSAPVVVVGGGTSGSIVARTLADLCTTPIVVCEPGPVTDDDAPRFMDGLVDSVLWPGLPMPQARAVGGGSAVNGMILSGAEPEWLRGLTRIARADEVGGVGRAILGVGGRLSRLWWNNGRWNPGRSMLHVEEEGRLTRLPATVRSLRLSDGRAEAVVTDVGDIECSHVVMCAGALLTPRVLLDSGVTGEVGNGLQNHPTVSFTVRHPDGDLGFFDSCVVRDMHVDGAIGLMIAFERESVTSPFGLITVSLMNPLSRGRVTQESIGFALLSEPVDAARMSALTDDAREVLRRSGLEIVGESEVHPVSHATSSCSSSVLRDGTLVGHRNVTIADASILPSVPIDTPVASVTIEVLRIARGLGEGLS